MHVAICLMLISLASFAEDNPQTLLNYEIDSSPVEIHGFISQGYLQTSHNNFFPTSKEGSFDFAEAGLNFNKQISGNLRAGAQLFARNYGNIGDFDASFDWFLLDYKASDTLGFRIGRIKIPHGLYNDTNDIDSSRVPATLPGSVYPTEQRDYILAQNGVEIYGVIDMGASGNLDYNIFRGTLHIDIPNSTSVTYEQKTSDVPYIYGARLLWDTPIDGLRLAQTYQKIRYDYDLFFPSLSQTFAASLVVAMGVSSIEYTIDSFQFAVEYAKWWADFDVVPDSLTPPIYQTHERYYGMVTYHDNTWLHPGVFYSETYPNDRLKERPQDFLKDAAAFVRIDLAPNWLLKLEWHEIHGTSGLSPALNNGKTTATMDKKWQMFVAKTTVYF